MRRPLTAVIRVNAVTLITNFFAWYEISKPNDSVRVQIVLKRWRDQ
jgi:hypothetical protein